MNNQMYTNWRDANLHTLQGLRTIDRAIAERLGYLVSDGDNPFVTRKTCVDGMHKTEHVPLPKYWQDTVYPWDAFHPSLQENGFMLWHVLQGETQTGVIAKKDPFEWHEYTIGADLPQGLPCCLMWLDWWDMNHASDVRKSAIREQIQPFQKDEVSP